MAETSEDADPAVGRPWAAALRPELEGLRAYVPEVPAGIRVKLDANEAPPMASPAAREAVLAAIARVPLERYPDPTAAELKAAIGARGGARPDEILCGAGSDEVIALLVNALARPRGRSPQAVVLAPSPTFVMYKITAQGHGQKCVEVPLDAAWDLDERAMTMAIEMMTPNLVFVATPNNPTGNAMTEARLTALARAARDAVVVVDEAYADYSGGSLRRLRAEHPNVAILRTVSKLGLAALRVGWLEADAALVRELDKTRQPFNLSATSQAAVTAALTDAWTEVSEHVAGIVRERARTTAELERLPGVSVTPSAANFLWIRTAKPAGEVRDALIARGVLVRSFHHARGRLEHQLRVSIGSASDNDTFLEALREVLAP
jgi:histidinol-phosphate aminotransferase